MTISPYNISIATYSSFERFHTLEQHLFSKTFELARYVVLLLCGFDHWIVAITDLFNKEIMLFNSLHAHTNIIYMKYHKETSGWFKYFLSWRFWNQQWNRPKLKWVSEVSKQKKFNDCALFMIRYIYITSLLVQG